MGSIEIAALCPEQENREDHRKQKGFETPLHFLLKLTTHGHQCAVAPVWQVGSGLGLGLGHISHQAQGGQNDKDNE